MRTKKFIISYKFADSKMWSNMIVFAINLETAKKQVEKEVAMAYGSYMASKIIIRS